MPIVPPTTMASANIASLGFSTGMPTDRATRSMAGPNAEQVNRMASAPSDTE